MQDTPLSPQAKKTIKSVFLILFLDLVGFSIIFPLFPDLMAFYMENDRDNALLQGIISLSQTLAGPQNDFALIVFFGGFLGALYSLLQFIASPFWGNLSDQFGRKNVMRVTLIGTFLSYVIWIFSASFTVLIISRVLAGLMSGNISVATACVSDVTSEKNRSKGMAFVGIAFALGFIFGPALGGAFSLISLDFFPYSHEFSAVALVASILSLTNIILFQIYFEETYQTKSNSNKKLINPIKILKAQRVKELNLINYSYFFYITIFSAMEFTLTFLAVERLSFEPLDNAYMFIFIGIVLILVQGGFVRRKAHLYGEKTLSLAGLFLLIPGFILLAYFKSIFILYFGLFFLAVASSLTIPTLTSLNSLCSPKDSQGKNLGVFRSMGSLARVLGPILGSVIYWKLSSETLYLILTIACFIPLVLVKILPKPPKKSDAIKS